MRLIEAIYHRRAVRNYTDKDVPRVSVLQLLDAAIQAPSAVNQQPWAFAVFVGRERLDGFSVRAKAHLLTTLEASPAFSHLRDMLCDPQYNIFHNAGTLVVICAKPGGQNPAEDCCLAAQNLMLAAHAIGLGTCPIGFARPWMNLEETKRDLGIPEALSVVFPITLGFPAEVPPAVPRNPPEIVIWK